jgi:hypothetical protein
MKISSGSVFRSERQGHSFYLRQAWEKKRPMAGVGCGTPWRTHSLHAVSAFSILVIDLWPAWQFLQETAALCDAKDIYR